MPYAIDQEALDSPNLKILDMNKPPVKSIPFHAFPQLVYLHPKDKTKTHRIMTVHAPEELQSAEKQGWKTQPHIPLEPIEDLSVEFEAEPVRRGPGRPAGKVE